MANQCQYCGDPLTFGHKDFGICGWCVKEIDDSQRQMKENRQPTYFSGDRDDFKGEVDYG